MIKIKVTYRVSEAAFERRRLAYMASSLIYAYAASIEWPTRPAAGQVLANLPAPRRRASPGPSERL